MLRARLLIGLLAAGALIAVPAAAKEGVHAILLKPLPLDAVAGERIRVDWRLIDDKGRPFGASGIYLRVSRCGRPPLLLPATPRGSGRYYARVRVPKGGIRKLLVGLKGLRIIGDREERADIFFQFDPPLAARGRCR